MKKQKKIIIITFLILISVILISKVDAEEKSVSQTPLRPKVEYKAEELQEPFEEKEREKVVERKITQKEPLPALTVQGIVWGGTLPQAIVENKVVKVGDSIGEARIIDINKNGLVLFYHGQQYNLSSPAITDLKKTEKIQEKTQEKTQEGGLK